MNEVEKLYENAGVEKRAYYNGCPKGQYLSNNLTCYECEYFSVENPYLKCSYRVYPPFTAEKQLELIKWLGKSRPIHITFLIDKWVIEGMVRYGKRYDTFEDALSGYINNIWQDLTESEQEQIRSILNGI